MDDNYLSGLGYIPTFQPYSYFDDYDQEHYFPETLTVMAKWSNGAFSCHTDVPNTVRGLFIAFDEIGDPAEVREVWCCEAMGDDTLDSDQDPEFKWNELFNEPKST